MGELDQPYALGGLAASKGNVCGFYECTGFVLEALHEVQIEYDYTHSCPFQHPIATWT